jgi:hypothetical protein
VREFLEKTLGAPRDPCRETQCVIRGIRVP